MKGVIIWRVVTVDVLIFRRKVFSQEMVVYLVVFVRVFVVELEVDLFEV